MRHLRTNHLRVLLLLALITLFPAGCSNDQRPAGAATVGQPAPAFTLTDLQGKSWTLGDLQGKVVFLNFWATWCPPCLKEMPSMAALHQLMAGQPFQMVTVLFNDRPEYAWNLARKMDLAFPVLVDNEGSVSNQYGLTGVPETYIIDSQGILREKIIGPLDWNSPAALTLLRQYLPRTVSQAGPAAEPGLPPGTPR